MKAFWRSLTLWFNVLAVLAAALIEQSDTYVNPLAVIVLIALGNIWLRFRTKTALSLTE